MLDLETMGTNPGDAVVAIGACVFDAKGICNTFYETISLESCLASGMNITGATIMWWMQQEHGARKEVFQATQDLDDALVKFMQWLPQSVNVWGNSASFDCGLLEAAYRLRGIPQPWPFWKEKCYRTVKGLAPGIPIEHNGTKHNALVDAIAQAEHLITIMDHLGLPF